eukprot:scaffold30635_cov135-Isochrysis_galbana.AAC.2
MQAYSPPLYQPLVAQNLHRSSASPPGGDALELGGCSWLLDASLGNVTLCEEGVWLNDAVIAQRSLELDALLASPPMLAIVPGGRSRHVLTAHYFGGGGGCPASPLHAYAVRAHAYCDDPAGILAHCTGDALHLTGVAPALLPLPSAPPRSPPPIAHSSPAGIDTPDQTEAACQLEIFVSVPALCTHPLLRPSAAAAAGLERLLHSAYASAAEGFVRGVDTAGGGAGPPGLDTAGGDAGSTETPGRGAVPAGAARALTYGEVAPHGMLQLLGAGRPGLLPGLEAPGSLFLDIGSGVGRLVLATALLTGAKAVGVEVVEARHMAAVRALARAQASGTLTPKQASRVGLLHADATKTTALPDATHAYLSNLCFPPDLEREIALALVALPSLRFAVTLRPLPPEALAASRDRVGAPTGIGGTALPRRGIAASGARAAEGPGEQGGGCALELVGGVTLAMTWTAAFPALLYCCPGYCSS